jgi:N-methylhydantoinase B
VEEVLRDIAWRKVSVTGAREDYGVVVREDGTADEAATTALRDELRAARTGEEPFFDRGPGYATLSGGAAFNEFDVL